MDVSSEIVRILSKYRVDVARLPEVRLPHFVQLLNLAEVLTKYYTEVLYHRGIVVFRITQSKMACRLTSEKAWSALIVWLKRLV